MSHQRMETLEISRASIESIGAIVTTTADPTGTPSRWAFTETSDPNPRDDGFDGGWTVWNSSTKKATAISPTMAYVGSQTVLNPGTYDIWINWNVGNEGPWKRIGRVKIY